MKRIPAVMIFLLLVLYGKAENPPSDKDKAGSLHQAVGRLAPGENALHRLRTPPASPRDADREPE